MPGAFVKKSVCLTAFPERSGLAFVCSIQQGSETQSALSGGNNASHTQKCKISNSHFDIKVTYREREMGEINFDNIFYVSTTPKISFQPVINVIIIELFYILFFWTTSLKFGYILHLWHTSVQTSRILCAQLSHVACGYHIGQCGSKRSKDIYNSGHLLHNYYYMY